MAQSDATNRRDEQQEQSPTEAVVRIAKKKEQVEKELKEVEPDTSEEAHLCGKASGLDQALIELEKLHAREHLPEWNIGIENDDGDWEWYYPHALYRESAIEQARSQAKEDLGGVLNVYEVGGPIVA